MIANVIAGPVLSIGYDLSPNTDPTMNTYVDLGFTQEGLSVEFEAETEDVYVDQLAVCVKRLLVTLKLKFTVNLADMTTTHMSVGIPGSSLNAGVLEFGQPDGSDTLQLMALEFTAEGPSGGVRTVVVPLCTTTGKVGVPFKRDGIQIMPTEFAALTDGTNPLVTVTDA